MTSNHHNTFKTKTATPTKSGIINLPKNFFQPPNVFEGGMEERRE
jgi:hypothetical protein